MSHRRPVFQVSAIAVLLIGCFLLMLLPAAAQDTPACENGFWLFDHERLATDPVCVPENPQRIISLDMPATEFVLLNDIPLVGVFGYAADEISAITPGLADKLADIPTFGWPPNLELVTELNPDLIIAFKDSSLFYEGMEEIAPLVVYDAAYHTDWKSSTAFWSQVFQKEDAYDQMMATYEARVAELQDALGEDRGAIEVSAFVPSPDYPMIWLIDSAQGVILQDVGLGRPASQNQTFEEGGYAEGGADYGFVAISNEALDLADGDEIFIFTWASTDPDVAAQNIQNLEDFHQNNALWQTLNGVREGNVHIVGPHWFRAQTYLAANLILDDLFAYLTDIEPTIPSPAAQWTIPTLPADATPEATTALPVVQAGFPSLNPADITHFEVIEETADTITVRHLHGETTFPRNPQRIVTDMNTAEILISLGIIPVGYLSPEGQGISPVIAEVAPDMTLLPVVESPNYEQILTLQPDLIIGASWIGTSGDASEYERMSALAPTVPFTIWPGLLWADSTRQVAALFGREAQAEAVIADYNQRVAQAREQIAPVFGDETVSQLLFFGPSAWLYSPTDVHDGYIYSEDSIGWLYYELELMPGPGMVRLFLDETDEVIPFLEITGELLPEIEAQHLIVFPNGYSGAEGISEGYLDYIESPIWQALPAVQAGNVYVITGVNKSRGYYTKLDNIEIFVDIVTASLTDTSD